MLLLLCALGLAAPASQGGGGVQVSLVTTFELFVGIDCA